MKKNLTVLVTVIMLMVTSLTLSYAAFPVSNGQETTIGANNTSNEEVANSATTAKAEGAKVAMMTKAHGHGGSGKSQVVAAVLCFFLGSIGIHRFYLGYTWQGIVQILTLGGCGIWALIDFIRILTGDLQPKGGSYDKTF